MKNKNNLLSAVIVTYNEEKNIERCLDSLSWVDEIIVIDSFSEDKTVEICENFNCKVIQKSWQGFGKTKSFAVNNASNDWILSIDADEQVSDSLREKIKDLLNNPKFSGCQIKINPFYLNKEIKYCGWNKHYPIRLFNKRFGTYNNKDVHESVKLTGEIIKISEPIYHYSYPTIGTHIKKMNLYSELYAEDFIKKGKEYSIISALFFGFTKFINMYFFRWGFLDGRIGLIVCFNSAIGVYLKYIKTWQQKT